MATFVNTAKNSETFANTAKAPAYSGAVAYVVDDRVVYQGLIYTCILNSTNNLPTNITYWRTGDRAFTNLAKS
jgi:hypothetical protein